MADKLAREPDRPTFTRRVYNRLKSNADALRKRLQRDTIEGASIDPYDIPSRYRKGWIGTALRDWRQRVSAERTKGQDLTAVQMVDDGCAASSPAGQSKNRRPPPCPHSSQIRRQPQATTTGSEEKRQAIRAAVQEAARRLEHAAAKPPAAQRTKRRQVER